MAAVGQKERTGEAFLGRLLDNELARGIVNGEIHPVQHVRWSDARARGATENEVGEGGEGSKEVGRIDGIRRNMHAYFDEISGE